MKTNLNKKVLFVFIFIFIFICFVSGAYTR